MAYIVLKFSFDQVITTIQTTSEEKMQDVFERYATKINKNLKDIYFLYGGNKIEGNKKVGEIIGKTVNPIIFVISYNTQSNQMNEGIKNSEKIICPKCKHSCIANISKDYKVVLEKCENGHSGKFMLKDFEKTQLVNEATIKCSECANDKSQTYHNKFYICCDCNKYYCPLCEQKHNKIHKVILVYDIYVIKCHQQDSSYITYCINCNKNLCVKCNNEHITHNKIGFDNYRTNLDSTIEKEMNVLHDNVNDIIQKLNNFY